MLETSYAQGGEAPVPGETPLEAAARAEASEDPAAAQTRREEREADMLVADIDSYVAQTDPASLPEAEKALNAWEIPSNPLDGVPGGLALPSETQTADAGTVEEGEALVSVFTAQSESEANIVRGVVEAAGIPVAFNGLPSPILGSIFQAGETRWADILVPAHLADGARAAIAEAMSSPANPQ